MMIPKSLTALAAIAALGSITGAAHAAPGPALPLIGGPNAISAGVFIPSSGAAKSAGGATQLDVEFHYGLPLPNPTPSARRARRGRRDRL